MRIIKAYPPNFSAIAKAFPVKGKQGILYAYGDIIYNPSDIKMPPWIRHHEEVHGRRQGEDVAKWWDLYIKDSYFRLYEELEAHQAEWGHYIKYGPINDAEKYLDMMATRLSSPLYALAISYEDARRRIRAGE